MLVLWDDGFDMTFLRAIGSMDSKDNCSDFFGLERLHKYVVHELREIHHCNSW